MAKTLKRELIEWVILGSVLGVLYLTGYHTEVIGRIQRMVLYTGLVTPDLDSLKTRQPADYQLTLVSDEGARVSLEDFRNKVIFLNFWASWCAPCRAEMPDIENLYQKVNQDEIVFIIASVDQDISKAKDYLKKKDFSFPVYFMESGRPQIYNTGSIPSTFVINQEGEIVLIEKGMASYDTPEFYSFLSRLAR